MPQRLRILDIPVDCVDMVSSLEIVKTLPQQGTAAAIFAVNPEKIIAAQSNPFLKEALERAALLIPDGIGVVAATRILHGLSCGRVPGADLMPHLCEYAAQTGKSIYLLGGAPGVADQAGRNLAQRLPKLKIAGTRNGYFNDDELDGVIEKITACKPDILFVAFGSPRQEIWIDRHIARLGPVLVQAVGGTFDVIAGNVKRAPAFFRDNHLEWFYRLASDPARLRRQKALPKFAAAVASEVVRTRLFAGAREAT